MEKDFNQEITQGNSRVAGLAAGGECITTGGWDVAAMAGAQSKTGRAKALGKRSFARPAPEVSLDRMHEEYLHSRRVENVRDSTLAMYGGALRPWAA